MEIEPFTRPEWSPAPHEGCRGVEGKGLLKQPGLALAMLRFSTDATIHEHSAPFPIDVLCLEGNGWISVDGEAAPFAAGQRVHWPANAMHRLWTDGSTMLTLMVEHLPDADAS